MNRVNADDLDWEETDRGEGVGWRRKRLAAGGGGDDLGCSLYELPAGKRAWPFHYHAGNAEALYVLSGEGTLRHADGTTPLRSGDYVALPSGEDGAHRVINDSDGALRYLMVSTMRDPEVLVYPDSDKVGAMAGAAPGGEGERDVDAYFRRGDAVDYWDGEEG
ncbi:cupin domain-containing protein [Halobaculum magnesiiphilum]|uniref:Cupin domain-containing protein n=1 Tax=Halobaculum magnesiiphilum TaxID=1017351 RepID=A0A8T8W9Y3_9EURY|nr:cupin domain-containing protein [Halobaculum magnesiiphilum]QZP36640.1 cupin domain-containing protein [Halobaculum magnesiiphilum]